MRRTWALVLESPAMTASMDSLMQSASAALVAMDYLTCEALCTRALAMARQAKDWDSFARILLPLQESRRQRRITAAGGTIRLGTTLLAGEPVEWLDTVDAACIVLTHPHDRAGAERLHEAARKQGKYVEVLLADNPASAKTWTIRSFLGPDVRCERPRPPKVVIDRWMAATDATATAAVDWFLDAAEALGDAALQEVSPDVHGVDRVTALEQRLAAAGDHERLHQSLWEAARQAAAAES